MDKEFTALYQKYKKSIFSYVYYLSGDQLVAEEVCQDVFLKVYLNITKFEGRASFKTWIYTIAKNTYFDFIRAQKNREFTLELENWKNDFIDQSLGPEEHILNKEKKELIEKTLKMMNEKYRSLLILRDIQHLSYKEISEVTNQELNTVKVGIYRARREFRKIYEGLEVK